MHARLSRILGNDSASVLIDAARLDHYNCRVRLGESVDHVLRPTLICKSLGRFMLYTDFFVYKKTHKFKIGRRERDHRGTESATSEIKFRTSRSRVRVVPTVPSALS